MNERIFELAAEAEDYADSIVDQGGEFHLTYTKKFAELIVRECADLLELEYGQSVLTGNKAAEFIKNILE